MTTGKRPDRIIIDDPHATGAMNKNPAEALRDIATRIGKRLGLEVDHEAFLEAIADPAPCVCGGACNCPPPPVNRNPRREPDGQSALPRHNRYSIPHRPRPGELECPYCVKRPVGPKGLRDHCRAVHPDKPEARQ